MRRSAGTELGVVSAFCSHFAVNLGVNPIFLQSSIAKTLVDSDQPITVTGNLLYWLRHAPAISGFKTMCIDNIEARLYDDEDVARDGSDVVIQNTPSMGELLLSFKENLFK